MSAATRRKRIVFFYSCSDWKEVYAFLIIPWNKKTSTVWLLFFSFPIFFLFFSHCLYGHFQDAGDIYITDGASDSIDRGFSPPHLDRTYLTFFSRVGSSPPPPRWLLFNWIYVYTRAGCVRTSKVVYIYTPPYSSWFLAEKKTSKRGSNENVFAQESILQLTSWTTAILGNGFMYVMHCFNVSRDSSQYLEPSRIIISVPLYVWYYNMRHSTWYTVVRRVFLVFSSCLYGMYLFRTYWDVFLSSVQPV